MVEVNKIGNKIIPLKIVVGYETINIISTHAPQPETKANLKKLFWEDLEGLIQCIPQNKKVFIGEDFNGHVRREANNYTRVHGGFGFEELNHEGQSILDFSFAYDFKIVNTCLKKRDKHLITYKNGALRLQINFLLVRNMNRTLYKNCKGIPEDGVTTQHKVIVLDVHITSKNQKH